MGDKIVKRVIFLGRSSAGKTTLCQRIMREEPQYHKTQTISILCGKMIDTPGEYLENRRMQSALMVAASEADVIAFVQDASEHGSMFPQAYASAFTKPVIGIITKCDLADSAAIERAISKLHFAGAKNIFKTSSMADEGVDELKKYLHY